MNPPSMHYFPGPDDASVEASLDSRRTAYPLLQSAMPVAILRD